MLLWLADWAEAAVPGLCSRFSAVRIWIRWSREAMASRMSSIMDSKIWNPSTLYSVRGFFWA
jgi:hypothetical protein